MNRFVSLFIAAPIALASFIACGGDDDTAAKNPDDPSTLSAPLSGKGFQFRTPVFSVEPGQERQDCYFVKVRDLAKVGGLNPDEPVNLHRIQIVQRAGSHHMNLFRVKTVVNLDPAKGTQLGVNGQGECFKSSNWADWPLIANTQQDGQIDWTFPDGVANVFQPDETVMLQTHYVNATSQRTPEGAEVAINWYTIPKDQVKHELGTVFATKQSIRVCKSNPTPEFSGTCQFKNPKEEVHIIGANGHFHGRGKNFDMFSWDGTSIAKPGDDKRFYHSQSWDDPPMLRSPTLDLTVPPNTGVFYTCNYQWLPPSDAVGGCAALDAADTKAKDAPKDCCYTFGPIVEKNEHCNAFVYYWPKQETGNVFCNLSFFFPLIFVLPLVGAVLIGCPDSTDPPPVDAGPPEASVEASTDGPPPSVCPTGYLGDVNAPIEIELRALNAAGDDIPLNDGDDLAIIFPPQGGRVAFVGIRAKNLDGCAVQITGALRDVDTKQVRLDGRTVNLKKQDDGSGVTGQGTGPDIANSGEIGDYSNVPLCPNQWASKDIYDHPFELEFLVTDRRQKTTSKKITVTPRCAESGDKLVACRCLCRNGYVLGEACGEDAGIDAGNP